MTIDIRCELLEGIERGARRWATSISVRVKNETERNNVMTARGCVANGQELPPAIVRGRSRAQGKGSNIVAWVHSYKR